ncbi:MAG: hypothetical protein LH478_07120 [Chitinophagaceae bacterium]|nr:hypothetical protein [Chitinophagaceae bacterium]
MRQFHSALSGLMAIIICGFTMQGCVKDTCTRRFTMMTPVYKTNEEVRANIKNSPAKEVQHPGKMFVLGNYIFLNEVDKGVHIIDNSNPAKPVNKYFVNIPGNIDLAVNGTTLYADLYSDMVTIDISNPASIVVNKVIEDAFPFRRYSNGFVPDNSKVIVDWIKKDTTVECATNWISPRGIFFMDVRAFSSSQSAAVVGVSGSMARFCLLNNYLYTVTDNELNVFNISQAAQPTLANKIPVGWSIETIYPFKSNLFIGSRAGMFIYGTSNPAKPNQVSAFSHATVCDPVIADDEYAYVTLRSGTTCAGFTNQLDVLDITNLSTPKLVKSYPLTNPHGLSKSGYLLFICDGADGLKVFNAAKADDIKLIKTVNGMDTFDVITYNNIAMVIGKDGLYQYSFTNEGVLTFLSKISIQPA